MKLIPIALCIFSAAAMLATASAAEKFEPTVVFMHRHGARSPQGVVVDSDGVQKAACEYPLCQLTDAGKAMCLSVGKYIKANFLDVYTPDAVQNGYNVQKYSTESTDTKRTVQSAEALMAGIFNKLTTPFVDFVPTALDYNMSFWTSWPSWRLGQMYRSRLNSYPAQYIQQHFTGGDSGNLLAQFGEAIGAQELCSRSPTDCMMLVADILECNASNGHPLNALFVENQAKIRQAKSVMFAKLMGYDPADTENSVLPGSFGYHLGIELLESLEYKNNSATWPYKVFHYSAHDWTLFPLYSALGFWTPDMMLDVEWIPRFADTLVLVTTDKGVNETTGEQILGVKAYRLAPEQVPAAGATPTSAAAFPVKGHTEIGLLCTAETSGGANNNNNNEKTMNKKIFSNETATGCTIEEVRRTVQLVAPRSSLGGKCFATQKNLEDAQCLSSDAPPVGGACEVYRAVCNQLPCGAVPQPGVNYEVDGGFSSLSDPERGYACTETRPVARTEYPTAIAVTLVSVGFVVGSVIGAVLVWKNYDGVKHHFEDSPGRRTQPVQQEQTG